jgi:hypothetical protein
MDASNCLHIEYPYSEGLGGVFIGKPGKPELEGCTPSGCAPMHYGCWFTMIPPVGQRSGAAVNVGKSLRANNRTEVARMLNVPCNGGANNDNNQTNKRNKNFHTNPRSSQVNQKSDF